MTSTVRDAEAEDLPGILSIYNEVVANSTAIFSDLPSTHAERTAWWQARVARAYPLLVAGDAGEITGFASFGDFRSWPGYRFTVEHSVHVRHDRRGQGVGQLLMTALMARAGALGKHAMIGGIDATNAGSIRFHERLGFVPVGHLREVGRKFDRWLDLILMQRLL